MDRPVRNELNSPARTHTLASRLRDMVTSCLHGWAMKLSLGTWCARLSRRKTAAEDSPQQPSPEIDGGYIVQHAGVPEVNGVYRISKGEVRDGAPCFRSKAGTLLFRYCMRSGSHFWYFSNASGNLNSADGDYYRVRSDSMTPPWTGWTIASCHGGRMPLPLLIHVPEEALAAQGRNEGEDGNAEPDLSHLTVELEVILLSGECLGKLRASLHWTVSQVKAALRPLVKLQDGAVAQLIDGHEVLEDDLCLGHYMSAGQRTLNALLQRYDVYVDGAGTGVVNGAYVKSADFYNGVCSYLNAHGIMLFRYRFETTGALYWYLSETGNLTTDRGDYYRIKTEDPRPPEVGWTIKNCPKGLLPAPTLQLASNIAEQDEEDDEEGDEEEEEEEREEEEAHEEELPEEEVQEGNAQQEETLLGEQNGEAER